MKNHKYKIYISLAQSDGVSIEDTYQYLAWAVGPKIPTSSSGVLPNPHQERNTVKVNIINEEIIPNQTTDTQTSSTSQFLPSCIFAIIALVSAFL